MKTINFKIKGVLYNKTEVCIKNIKTNLYQMNVSVQKITGIK